MVVNTKASHNYGGEITYEWVSTSMYNVRLVLYVDCQGPTPSPSINININSSSCSLNQVKTLFLTSTKDVSQVCDTNLLACNGGTLTGVTKLVYDGVVTSMSPCPDWILSYTLCCRNAAVNNILNPNASNFYIETKVNNTVHLNNKSPYFVDEPRWMAALNFTNNINAGAYDPDGDSLYFSLVAPQGSNGNPLNYNAGYSPTQPFSIAPVNSFNSQTGIYSVNPANVGSHLLSVKVEEFRNGQLIGSVVRDFTTNVYLSSNTIPEITNTTLNFNKCITDSLSVDLFSFDNTDTITTSILYPYPSNFNVPIFSNTTAPLNQNTNYLNDTNTLSWNLTGTLPNKDYIIYVNVEDHLCPIYNIQSYAIVVSTSSCDSVWPGDANSDFTANMYDIFPLGLFYNTSGPTRPSATINWNAQVATDWGVQQASSADIKHADCNGDGNIDANDTTAILLNYSLMHSKGGPTSVIAGINDPTLFVDIVLDTVPTSTALSIPIKLGTPSNPADSIYGIAMSITYDKNLVDSIAGVTVDYSNSWIGTKGIDMITLDTNFYNDGQIDIGLVRTDGQMINGGFGEILTLNIITIDNLSGKTTIYESLIFDFKDVVIIDNKEGLRLFNQQLDSVVIEDATTGIQQRSTENHVKIIPNPNQGNFKIYVEDDMNSTIGIYNTIGQLIDVNTSIKNNYATINMADFEKGLYFIQIHNQNKGTIVEKVIIQ